jgi:hypothetical protein
MAGLILQMVKKESAIELINLNLFGKGLKKAFCEE